ncbi:MAG: DUF928 domain-containing protein [Cyanobacteria bacterium SBLK]|nr:DUF928 domain-containing protein [Cyanobacteria bacterium SBLK]
MGVWKTVTLGLAIALAIDGSIVRASETEPAEQGAPQGTSTSADRGLCDAEQPLIPLVFKHPREGDRELAWSFANRPDPTFWAYIPYAAENITSAKLSLRREDAEMVYKTDVEIAETPGIVRVQIPPTLERGQWYRWSLFLDVFCTPDSAAQTDATGGWIKWETSDPDIVKVGDIQRQAQIYAKAGFLQTALTLLAESPEAWRNLLRSVNLEKISTEPLTDCCEIEGVP